MRCSAGGRASMTLLKQHSRGNVVDVSAYSIMPNPMTSCGCFECIAAFLDQCNGIMTVDRDFRGDTRPPA